MARFAISQRRASRLLGRSRSTLRYHFRPRGDEAVVVRALRRLARRHPRYGYRRIHARLRKQGWAVNRKRVRRLWNELGLRRPLRLQTARKLGPKPGSSANRCVNQPARFKNDVWTAEFIADRTTDGRPLKWLSLVDEYTREGLALRAAETLTGHDVRRLRARVSGRRQAAPRIRSANGSAFSCPARANWLPAQGSKPIPAAPGSPWENGFSESFHSRVRDEFLERHDVDSVADAQAPAHWWRREYNTMRPHSALGYQTPKEFSDAGDRKQQPVGQS